MKSTTTSFEDKIDKGILSQCEKFRSIRAAAAAFGIPPKQQELSSLFSISSVAGHHHYPSSELITPSIAQKLLSARLGWVFLQAGFEAIFPSAHSIICGVTAQLFVNIGRSLKLYIERGQSLNPTELASRLVRDHFKNGPLKLLRFLVDEPNRIRARMDRALSIIEEYRQHNDEGGNFSLELPDESLSGVEAIAEDDVDLDLLGEPQKTWSYPSRPGRAILTEPPTSEYAIEDVMFSGPDPEEGGRGDDGGGGGPSLRELLDDDHTLLNGIVRKRSLDSSSPLPLTSVVQKRSRLEAEKP